MGETFELRLELSLWSIFIHRVSPNFLYNYVGVCEIALESTREDEGSDNGVGGAVASSEEGSMIST